MFVKFASIRHADEFGYAFDSEQWQGGQIDSRFRMFHTYGHGLTQHSGDWAVTREYAMDYLASLAQAMLTNDELAERLAWLFNRGPKVEEIAYAASVVYKDSDNEYGKGRYYSVSERKTTSQKSKQYDKRYSPIKAWNDGSPLAVFTMLIPDYADGLHRYCVAERIREWQLAQSNGYYMDLPGIFLGWFEGENGHEKARELRHAFNACRCITEAYRLRHEAMQAIAYVKPEPVKPEPAKPVTDEAVA